MPEEERHRLMPRRLRSEDPTDEPPVTFATDQQQQHQHQQQQQQPISRSGAASRIQSQERLPYQQAPPPASHSSSRSVETDWTQEQQFQQPWQDLSGQRSQRSESRQASGASTAREVHESRVRSGLSVRDEGEARARAQEENSVYSATSEASYRDPPRAMSKQPSRTLRWKKVDEPSRAETQTRDSVPLEEPGRGPRGPVVATVRLEPRPEVAMYKENMGSGGDPTIPDTGKDGRRGPSREPSRGSARAQASAEAPSRTSSNPQEPSRPLSRRSSDPAPLEELPPTQASRAQSTHSTRSSAAHSKHSVAREQGGVPRSSGPPQKGGPEGSPGDGSGDRIPAVQAKRRSVLEIVEEGLEMAGRRAGGLAYRYDETSGLLVKEGTEGGLARPAVSKYVENAATGSFYRVKDPPAPLVVTEPNGGISSDPPGGGAGQGGVLGRVWRGRAGLSPGKKRKEAEPVVLEDSAEMESPSARGEEHLLLDVGPASEPPGPLDGVQQASATLLSVLALFVQGLLGGLAALAFFFIYFSSPSGWGTGNLRFLQFYAPIAMTVGRVLYALIATSLVCAINGWIRQVSADRRAGRMLPRRLEPALIMLYTAAFITTILCTPFDDELQYDAGRDADFYRLPLPPLSGFRSRLAIWQWLNLVRLATSAIAWALVCWKLLRNGYFGVPKLLKGALPTSRPGGTQREAFSAVANPSAAVQTP